MPVHERNPAYKRGRNAGRYSFKRTMNPRAEELRLSRPRRDPFGQLVKEQRFGGKMELAPAKGTPILTFQGGSFPD